MSSALSGQIRCTNRPRNRSQPLETVKHHLNLPLAKHRGAAPRHIGSSVRCGVCILTRLARQRSLNLCYVTWGSQQREAS
jgi:hypothetical protein